MIYDLTPFSTIDFPGEISAIVWFAGCNMRCRYCQNPDLVTAQSAGLNLSETKAFLRSRKGLLSAVVMSGGECTSNAELVELCALCKELNFRVKIDTNGSNSARLGELISAGLIDFCALDFKIVAHKFSELCGADFYEEFWRCFDALKNSNTPFEVRTTVHSAYHEPADIYAMHAALLERGYSGRYALQRYRNSRAFGDCKPCENWQVFEQFRSLEGFEIR